MRIEDCWEDKKSYYVSFLSSENKIINRNILLSPDIQDKYEIETIVYQNFNQVKEVLAIDELDDALLLKEVSLGL
ncbi:MAG: hypothetical protein ACTIDE_06865 [Carnobacterium maltaromaticum]